MKKNISINISGIIFHIEEDAYEQLRDYLDSINRYFSSFDGSQEIIADIESRIAEIFLAKLNEEKQIITAEDVSSLIATMGSIKDFQAVEDAETDNESNNYQQTRSEESHSSWSEIGSKKLYRDGKRRIIAGVCAGLGHYFHLDPLWVRLLLIILSIGSYGTFLIAYIILWIVLPENKDLDEDQKIKKMFRNPNGKVISGVSSGVATYFGVDVAVIRLLFIIFTFVFGSGVLVYLILWIVLPEAKTITDKVQMEGDPVTLSNIESSIKKSLNVDENEENIFIKVLLFPFRLIAAVLNGLGRILGPILMFLVDFIRIILGAILILTGASFAISFIILLGVSLGFYTWGVWIDFPLEAFLKLVPPFTSLLGFFALAIPSILLILLGASIIAKKIIFSAPTGWSLLALFIVSSILVSINITEIAFEFKEDGDREVVKHFDIQGKTAVLKLNEVGLDDYDITQLTIKGYDGDTYKLNQYFSARGRSRQEAIENSKDVTYNVKQEDSVLYFDSNIQFNKNSIFHAQELSMTLFVPYNHKFILDDDMRHILRSTPYVEGYSLYNNDKFELEFKEDGTLECAQCPIVEKEEEVNGEENDDEEISASRHENANGKFDQLYTFQSFNALEVSNSFVVHIVKADSFQVGINANRKYRDNVDIYVKGEKLYIDYNKGSKLKINDFLRDDISITVYTPSLQSIKSETAGRIYLSDFREQNMDIDLSGASFAKLSDVNIGKLTVDLSGASELDIDGKGQNLSVEMQGASQLDAMNFETEIADIEAHGASSARVYVTKELRKEENFASDIKYKGNPEVINE
ncbi:PspC domain-containing protein [Fulvivirga maritima]|uniref:PspC domain-containing protein n=1 Tax=Fulvivirga maritima TaxID=2904247 RepID=UPI001F174EF0|nr:PspC domain-containing protein [Fulvivirga maritima]UII24968.1 PspC domain-containing protein [Fulvivirga maritima]